ncbi:hypothetical protein LTR96_001688 [Exophiala xenobiotica]|uniref:Ketoreductase domain-containing protein n=1 Tax=Vermiconidia calcicola TaxID=1690605 RepID=A0AAV9Q1Z1_9PEZI|nr:hypothetical protein LTR96_001688 [Exophiala xenobiotica]KAK5336083.1 hypothetical protein LTR98_007413 [Exophiala xenobiotica]KAK5427106.1 hypothetical protein LTR34_009611 [Exophiala xenobiotica]KAK5530311.1 hypothetical protein LTR23_010350 [Chaetothyriales sp. CCFEE 6169]KAK5533251.1 hypothetical protein LTR25_007116 [Vermiconidia calcicola]
MAPPACASRRAIRSFTVTHSPKTESPSVRGAAGHERYKSQSIQDLLSLKGRVTVVTGGARGIGLALAHGAAELGSDVAVLDILDKPNEAFDDLEKDLGVRAKYYRTSVTDAESLSKAFEAVSTDFGRIDNCVTAAGIVCDRPFQETPRDEGMRVLEVNVMGTYLSAQLAVKQMQKQKSGGSIVMIASIAARAAIPSQRLSVYGASKGAIRALCRQLAVELGPLGIRVNSISPGYIETEMTRGLAATNPELLSVFGSAAPLQRMGDRADLKTIAAYLLSDAAAYTTGSDVLVTGGLHAGRF